ncbi:hypothetical protein N7528_007868 [Penicillium herquei]|nr:hypothetical protein N7528_007868 [Penicillium herquei]
MAQLSPTKHVGHRSSFSLSLVSRKSPKRQSIIESPDSLPTCAERGHYPVFNPQDPRHNPSLGSCRRQDSHTSSSDSQKQSNWVQDFPRRSLHKARSGLLAIREGLRRRSIPSTSQDDSILHSRGQSSVSTQEDLSFGVALYRTNRPWPLLRDEPSLDALMRAASLHPLVSIASAPEMLETYDLTEDDLVFQPEVSIPFHRPLYSSGDGFFDSQFSPNGREIQGENKSAGHSMEPNREILEAHFNAPTDWENIGTISTSSVSGEDRRPQGLKAESSEAADSFACKKGRLLLSEPQILQRDRNSNEVKNCMYWRESSTNEGGRDTTQSVGAPRFPKARRNSSTMCNSSSIWSTFSSNASYRRRNLSGLQSEAFETQERFDLMLDREIPSPVASTSSKSSLTEGSLEVLIAFPGLHQALLEQWRSDSVDESITEDVQNTHIVEDMNAVFERAATMTTSLRTSIPNILPGTPHQTYETVKVHIPSEYSDEMQPFDPLLVVSPERLLEGDVETGRQQQSHFPNSAPRESSLVDIIFALNETSQREEKAGPQQVKPAQTRYSFGLHISLRGEPEERFETNPWSQPDFNRFLIERQSMAEARFFNSSSLWGWDNAESPLDASDYSYLFTRGSAMSLDRTSMTSRSSPLNSPIDEEVLSPRFSSNEYWTADGKPGSFYPDTDDQPVKARKVPAKRAPRRGHHPCPSSSSNQRGYERYGYQRISSDSQPFRRTRRTLMESDWSDSSNSSDDL